ncbi:VOC family protein [Echinicola sp. CAU 1574]|uniref:VOC family protein n=1 Tax=Echinicola arenosa TaxID=2774144 RepID=A0ABR9AGM7_9BACT|nr:VOC family protein [Echinicola arenosa]MBD8487401.1 VOC family protein [Echinicola arenosa]
MNQIISYLTFNGNCREAMSFYQNCFGGTLSLQTVGESPHSNKLPENYKGKIVHAILKNKKLTIIGTDLVDEVGLQKGNSISLLIDTKEEEELFKYYDKLAAGAKSFHPIQTNFWGVLFGGLTDKFGHHWLFQCRK